MKNKIPRKTTRKNTPTSEKVQVKKDLPKVDGNKIIDLKLRLADLDAIMRILFDAPVPYKIVSPLIQTLQEQAVKQINK